MITGQQMRIVVVLSALELIAFSGCGPVLSVSGIANAQRYIDLARQRQAEQWAPYEYQLAIQYWKKAKEEQGYSQYEASVKFANKAELFARRAQKRAMENASEQQSGKRNEVLQTPSWEQKEDAKLEPKEPESMESKR